ncbi:MAG: PIN domain-containing protein [Oscillospiraceae bacterium]|nr:PIN domain-containing protein [Oscillospiraceae bacterium]
MDYVFIDSNIWLSLYHFSRDDLKQFGRLKTLVDAETKLIIPSQLRDELIRNRETKLKESMKDFDVKQPNVPTFAKEYAEEYDAFNIAYREAEKKFKIWKGKIDADIKAETTPADKVIMDLFNIAAIIDCDDSMVSLAYDRYNRGNPPGKDKKYGDAINWECLLKTVPEGSELYLVSADKDYRSVLSDDELNPFFETRMAGKEEIEYLFLYIIG